MTLCIYHGGCDDGFAAAWVVWKKLLGDVDFHYGTYQEDPPDCQDRDVVIVDFSYKRPVIEQIIDVAKSVLVLDHHESAEKELAGLEGNIFFDMERSGAMMAWDYFFPHSPCPEMIEYIQDRDLWHKKLTNSDQVIMALRSYPQEFEVWDELMQRGPVSLAEEGKAIHRYYRTIVEAIKRNSTRAVIGGYDVPVANSPFNFASDVAGELAEEEPFAACYWIHAHGVTYSLRSRKNGVNVSEVATQYGGGGHAGAAGFKTQKVLNG